MDVVIPKLGLTMESGILLSWLVPDQTVVESGHVIAEVATDKVDHELEAPASGVLTILVEADDHVELPVGTRIGSID